MWPLAGSRAAPLHCGPVVTAPASLFRNLRLASLASSTLPGSEQNTEVRGSTLLHTYLVSMVSLESIALVKSLPRCPHLFVPRTRHQPGGRSSSLHPRRIAKPQLIKLAMSTAITTLTRVIGCYSANRHHLLDMSPFPNTKSEKKCRWSILSKDPRQLSRHGQTAQAYLLLDKLTYVLPLLAG